MSLVSSVATRRARFEPGHHIQLYSVGTAQRYQAPVGKNELKLVIATVRGHLLTHSGLAVAVVVATVCLTNNR